MSIDSIEERRLRTQDRRANAENVCMCAAEPWRFSHHKVVGDIERLEAERGTLWAKLDGMVSLKMFGLFMSILTTILVAFCASMYDTNKKTLAIVTQINEKVVALEIRHPPGLLPNSPAAPAILGEPYFYGADNFYQSFVPPFVPCVNFIHKR